MFSVVRTDLCCEVLVWQGLDCVVKCCAVLVYFIVRADLCCKRLCCTSKDYVVLCCDSKGGVELC